MKELIICDCTKQPGVTQNKMKTSITNSTLIIYALELH